MCIKPKALTELCERAEAVSPGAKGVPAAAMAHRKGSLFMGWNIWGEVRKHLWNCRSWLTFCAGCYRYQEWLPHWQLITHNKEIMKLLQILLLLCHEFSIFPRDSPALISILYTALLCVHAQKSQMTQQSVNGGCPSRISILQVLILACTSCRWSSVPVSKHTARSSCVLLSRWQQKEHWEELFKAPLPLSRALPVFQVLLRALRL